MRRAKKAAPAMLGIRKQAASRTVVDKSQQDNHLQENLGKKFRPQLIKKGVEQRPKTLPTTPQVSAEKRHSVRSEGALQYLSVSQLGLLSRAQSTGSSSETPVKNRFRSKLAALPAEGFAYGEKAAAVLPRLDALTRALFLEGRTLDLWSLSTGVFPASDSAATDTVFYEQYARLVATGRIRAALTGKAGAGQTPYAFDLVRHTPFRAHGSLRTVLQAYLNSNASQTAKTAATAAARVLLGLERYGATESVLHEARLVPCEALHGLAERFIANAASYPALKPKSIANGASALRSLIAFGLQEDLFPLFFPAFRPNDAWTQLVDESFALATVGATDGNVRKARCGLFALFAEARDVLRVPSPDALTATHIITLVRQLSLPHRNADTIKVAGLKKVAGKAAGNWSHPVIALVVQTLNDQRPIPGVDFLQHAGVQCASISTAEGFLEALASHGFSHEWPEFFTWYHEYSTLNWREIAERENEFPGRRPIRKLGPETFSMRLRAARAFLHAAKMRFPTRYSTFTPIDVFGIHFKHLTQDIYKAWEQSARNPHSVSHRASSGLHHLICAGGMIARALFDLHVHRASLARGNSTTSGSTQ